MSNITQRLHPHYRGACASFAEKHNVEQVAASIGMSSHVLRNKFNEAQKHKLSGDDLIKLTLATKDQTLLQGVLFECGYTAMPIPAATRAPSMTHQVIDLTAKLASLGQRALEITSGGRITRSERNTLVSVATSAMGSLAILIHDIEARFQAVPTLACASDILMQTMTM